MPDKVREFQQRHRGTLRLWLRNRDSAGAAAAARRRRGGRCGSTGGLRRDCAKLPGVAGDGAVAGTAFQPHAGPDGPRHIRHEFRSGLFAGLLGVARHLRRDVGWAPGCRRIGGRGRVGIHGGAGDAR